MSRLLNDFDSNNAVELYQSGVSVKNIARKYCVSEHVIRDILKRANVVMCKERQYRQINPPLESVLGLYNKGIGVAGIATRLGFTRTQMISFFRRNNIPMRNKREQQIERMKYSTPEQIKRLTQKAHEVSKGRKMSDKKLHQHALTRQINGVFGKSIYENTFAEFLKSNNINFIRQFAIDRYNIDFVIGKVGVEIFGGQWHRTGDHLARFSERTKKILNCGFSLIFVFVNDVNKFESVITDYIIPNIKELSTNKTFIGQYRVIWSNGKYITTGGVNDVDIALVCPTINTRDRTTGRYKSVAK